MQHFGFGRSLVALGVAGAQELVAETDGQIAVDDYADVGAAADEVNEIAPEQFGRLQVPLRRRRCGMGSGRKEGDLATGFSCEDGADPDWGEPPLMMIWPCNTKYSRSAGSC